MTVAVPEAAAPAAQVLTEFRLETKRRGTDIEFRLTARRRRLEYFAWDKKVNR